MRLAFVMTGVGAACVFTVVSSRMTLGLHLTNDIHFAEGRPTANFTLSAGGELLDDSVSGGGGVTDLAFVPWPVGLGGVGDGLLPGPPSPQQLLMDAFRPGAGFGGGSGFRGGGGGGGLGGGQGSASSSSSQDSTSQTTQDSASQDTPPPPSAPALGGSSGLGTLQAPPPPPPPPPDDGPTDQPSPPAPPPPPPPPLVTVPLVVPPPPPVVPPPTLNLFTAPTALLAPSAAPEPSIWISLVLGFGAMGAIFRRRRRQASHGPSPPVCVD